MAQYFSKQTLLDMRDKDMNGIYDLTDLEEYLAGIPTADVAPRAEVARQIILEIDELICCHANGDIDDKRLYILFDELKKKYTEEQK